MFEYGYRAWDRHKKEVSSLVILGDGGPEFRPDRFSWSRWGTEMTYRFPVVKLLDFRERWSELEESRNIFAVVVMAYLKTQDTRHDPQARLQWKLSLVRRLYERRYSREEIVSLFRLIDWMMQIPPELAIIFEEDLESIEAEYQMPYLSSIERRAMQKGLEEGQVKGFERGQAHGEAQGRMAQLRKLLEHRFGPLPDWTADLLGKATPSLLDDWAVRLLDASRVEDVFA
jgi:hypothetical protein